MYIAKLKIFKNSIATTSPDKYFFVLGSALHNLGFIHTHRDLVYLRKAIQ
jgi:hypothetical protein